MVYTTEIIGNRKIKIHIRTVVKSRIRSRSLKYSTFHYLCTRHLRHCY